MLLDDLKNPLDPKKKKKKTDDNIMICYLLELKW